MRYFILVSPGFATCYEYAGGLYPNCNAILNKEVAVMVSEPGTEELAELEEELGLSEELGEEFGEMEEEEFLPALPALAGIASAVAPVAAQAVGGLLGGLFGGDGEAEYEAEPEYLAIDEFDELADSEDFLDSEAEPMSVSDAELMEELAGDAAEADSEEEAEAFIGALVPLAAAALPKAAPMIRKVAPHLIKGAARLTRTLRRRPKTRPLVRAVPTIVRRTAASIARDAARGQPVTPGRAVRKLAGQTSVVLRRASICVPAVIRSKKLRKRYRRRAGRPATTNI
jgi:hypothetical protein